MKLLAFFVVLIMGIFSVFFSLLFGKTKHTLDYDNEKHLNRFIFTFFLFLLVSVGLAFLPVHIWPLPVMVLCMMLFSNQMTGLVTAALFTTVSTMAAGKSMYEFALYFSVCLITVLVFHGLDESVKFGLPIFINISSIAVIEAAFLFLANGKNLRTDSTILAIVNLFICAILEVIVLKIFCTTVLFKDRDRFLIINDTEFALMKELKETDKAGYMQAIHTAYLSDKISNALHITSPEIKTASYYFRMLSSKGKDIDKLCDEHRFPLAAKKILQELCDKKSPVQSKEAGIVLLADGMILAVNEELKKSKEHSPDYEKLVDALITDKKKTGILEQCNLTIRELHEIENTLLKETLYYDFLR